MMLITYLFILKHRIYEHDECIITVFAFLLYYIHVECVMSKGD